VHVHPPLLRYYALTGGISITAERRLVDLVRSGGNTILHVDCNISWMIKERCRWLAGSGYLCTICWLSDTWSRLSVYNECLFPPTSHHHHHRLLSEQLTTAHCLENPILFLTNSSIAKPGFAHACFPISSARKLLQYRCLNGPRHLSLHQQLTDVCLVPTTPSQANAPRLPAERLIYPSKTKLLLPIKTQQLNQYGPSCRG
jgi:hypothetical protein